MIPSLKTSRSIESIRIAIGEKGVTGKKAPTKLSHFIFTTTQKNEKRYMRDVPMTDLFGDKPEKIPIMLLSDDIEVVMPTFYAKYAQSGVKVRSEDGENWTVYNDDGTRTLVKCDPDDCKYLKDKDVKPHAIMTGVIDCDSVDNNAHLGEKLFKFRTTSWNTMHALLHEMNRVKDACGGHLAYLPLNLIIFPKMVRPKGMPEMVAYIVSLEPRTTMADLRMVAAANAESLAAITQHSGGLERDAARLSDAEEESIDEQVMVHEEFHPDAEMVAASEDVEKQGTDVPAPKEKTPPDADESSVPMPDLPKGKKLIPMTFPDALSDYTVPSEFVVRVKQMNDVGTIFDVNNTKVYTDRTGNYWSEMSGFSGTRARVQVDIVDALIKFGDDKVIAFRKNVLFELAEGVGQKQIGGK